MDARLQCMVGESFDLMDAGDPDDPQDAAIMAAQAQTRLVVSDGTREIELPGHQVVRFLCVDGTALALEASAPFGSRRSFAAIDLSRGRIRAARRMAIVDHEEASSQCANAWDGVDLVPIVGAGVLVGGVVRGALASPRFDVGRGDVGDVEGLADSESALLAYRVAGTSLEAIAEGDARAAVCSTRVADDDGETNVRPDPSTRRPPVGALPNGTVLRTVEQRGRWYRIEQPVAGWVWSEGLERRCR